MSFKFLRTLLLTALLSTNVFAEDILNVDVVGNKRLSKETIVVLGKIEMNKDYSDNDLNIILKNLYSSNFFEDIQLKLENNLLKITIIENPIIETIEITGVKVAKFEEYLLDSLSLKGRNSYTKTAHQNDINLIKNILKESGYYFSEVKTSLTNNEDQNSIRLLYTINLGNKAKIDKISFIGDKVIKDRKLKNVITSEEAKFWKFISKNIYLDKSRINLDQRLLKNYYKNKGYYAVKINNSFVELRDDGLFKLIFNINAGKKFKFNSVKLEIPEDYDPRHFESINNFLNDLENKNYSLNRVNKIIKEVDKIAMSKNYEFISADLDEKLIDGNKLDVTIFIKETKRFYVEKINVLGNQFTLEEVIRNEFLVDEGDPYNELIFNKSLNNLKSKGIFKTVTSTISDGSKDNLKIIDVIIEEKPTGEIAVGAGVGTSGGSVSFGIKENNFLGRGISLDTNLTLSENTIKGKFVYSKPNFNYTDNTLYTSLSSTSTDNLETSGYKTSNIAFSLGTGFEQYEDLYFTPSLAASLETLETSGLASSTLKNNDGDYFDLYFNYSLDNDLRNQRYQPSDGHRNIFSQELPLTSEKMEIVNSFTSSIYRELHGETVGRAVFFSKAVNALSNEDVRVSKRLFIPSSKLRGFEAGKVGPVVNGDFIGGNYYTGVSLSSTLPKVLPSLQNLDVSLFVDTANIWGVDYDGKIDDSNVLRSSAGVSLDVGTPIGPLSFSLSSALSKASTDKTESFRFNLGTTF